MRFTRIWASIVEHAGFALTFHECRWFSKYRIHHRRAEKFRDRRCFLLGDAAHIHSPVGAQGMNTGLQDAYNLAWKLALVTEARASEVLLDSYEAERLPVAMALLKGTDTAFSIIVSDRWLSGILRTQVMARIAACAMRFHRMQKFAFRTISQIGIHYRASSLSETLDGFPAEAPRAGDRFPWLRLKFSPEGPVEDLFTHLDDTLFNLIVIGQPPPPIPPELDGLLRIHEIPVDPDNEKELARVKMPHPSFYLLRPDCYIGLAGARLDPASVTRYVAQRLHVRSPATQTTES